MTTTSSYKHMLHLDAIRGAAAVAVVVGHIRGFVMVDYSEAPLRGIATSAVYLVTGLGHEAVIAFFALSGFLVGGSALQSIWRGTWSATDYIVARISRLWTVVIPALILTWCLDQIGRYFFGFAGYDGAYWTILSSGPKPDVPVSLDGLTFFGNMLFLQTIAVPVLGTNGPLWSLANEFWYYVIFICLFWAGLSGSGLRNRLTAATVGLGFAYILPWPLVVLGLVWLAGAIGRIALDTSLGGRIARHWFAAPFALILLASSLVVGETQFRFPAFDLMHGFAWAIVLPALAVLASPGGRVGRVYTQLANGLSEISFTLYATHFPILALIYFSMLAPHQLVLGPPLFFVSVAMLVAALISATVMWWLFERRTKWIRGLMLAFIQRRR